MIIEVHADVVSERAYLAQRQLTKMLERSEHGTTDRWHVVWRPVLIDPTAPTPSADLTDPSADVPSLSDLLLDTAAAQPEGVHEVDVASLAAGPQVGPRFQPRWRPSSWAAHRMITAALDHGPDVQHQVVHEFTAAHFEDGTDINDAAFLRSMAGRFDLPAPVVPDGSGAALAYMQPGFAPDDPVERATREALLFGQAFGVTVSPTFVVQDRVVFADDGAWPAKLTDVLPQLVADADLTRPLPPAEVRRFRAARALLERRNPSATLYLLEPLRADYAGQRDFEMLTAQALAASASLKPARDALTELLEDSPDDAYLHHMLGKVLRRLNDPRADRHLAMAAALDPAYAD